MPDQEEDLSPEEKLLRVIQGESSEEKGASADAPGPAPAPLILADDEAGGEATGSGFTVQADDLAEADADGGPDHSAPAALRAQRPGRAVTTTNWCLAVLVVVILCFAGYQIWASIQMGGNGPAGKGLAEQVNAAQAQPDVTDEFASPPEGTPSLDALRVAYASRPIIVGRDAQNRSSTNAIETTEVSDWQPMARQQLDLIGTAGTESDPGGIEAIVVDTKSNKMHFLEVGQSIKAANKELTVQQILANKVILTSVEDDKTVEIQ